MSQTGDDPTGKFSVRIEDPELAAAIEEQAAERGSKSEVMRSGLRESILSESDDDVDAYDTEVPVKAREGHRKLVEFVGVDGHLELEAAESILANHLNIKSTSVRQVVTRPLVNADWLSLQQGVHEVSIVVRDPDAELDAAGDVADELTADVLDPDAVREAATTDADDVETAGDRLDELAAAGEEVDDA